MELTQEQRKQGRKYCILQLLSWDIDKERFAELQQLYETANIDNQKIVQKLYAKRNIGYSFTDMIYYDIMYVLVDEIMDNNSLEDIFKELYAKRFPHISTAFSNIETEYSLNNHIPDLFIKRFPKMKGIETVYYKYLVYASETFQDREIFKKINFEKDMYYLNYSFYMTDMDNEDVFFKFNDDEEIFESKLFQKYLNNRKKDLAEYLNIQAKDLTRYIHNEMKSQDRDGADENDLGGTPLRGGCVGIAEYATKSIIANKNGGNFWYELVTNDQIHFRGLLKYVPDVESIITYYYKSMIKSKFIDKRDSKENFTKITLSRECVSANPKDDLMGILFMYELDVLYKMFSTMMEKYYQDFSWEKITKTDLISRYEKILENQQKLLSEKNNKISELHRNITNLTLQISAENNKSITPLVLENNKLSKVIDCQQSEIDELRQRLKYQENFINELSKGEECFESNEELDISKLQEKKYLFVGRIDEAIPGLKHAFPNSIFMNSETTDIANVRVDAIVMLIKWMSHSMFYKVKSANIIKEVPCILCNAKNTKLIYAKMYREFIS